MKKTSKVLFVFFTVEILVFLILLACKNFQNDKFDLNKSFIFNSSSYIKFIVINCDTNINLRLNYTLLFPPENYTFNIRLKGNDTNIIGLYITHPLEIELNYKNAYAYIFCIPGDTLEVLLEMTRTKRLQDIIFFKGTTASVSEYLTRCKIRTSYLPVKIEKIESYNKRIDNLTEKRLISLRMYNSRHTLPDWFFKMEKNDIKYSGAKDKVYQFKIRNLFNYKYKSLPEKFTGKFGVKLDNPEAKFSLHYYSFLCNLSTIEFYKYIGSSDVPQEILYSYIKKNIDFAKKYLRSEMRDIFIAQRICILMSNDALKKAKMFNDSLYFKRLDSLITFAQSYIVDKDISRELMNYHEHQLELFKVP